jgi:acetyl esterase
MPVKPEVRIALDLIEAVGMALSEQTPEGLRQAYDAFAQFGTKAEVESVTDRTISGPGGELPIRIYRPAAADGSDGHLPALVWFHGGGWVIGNLETTDGTARALANAAEVVVVSVDYRLAPEDPFPAGLDDALASVQWVASNAAELGIDPGQLAVGGDSAGGNLAAVVSQQLRDGGPPIRFQLLVYPVTDGRLSLPSLDENAEGYFLTKEVMEWFWDHYVGGGDRHDPRVSPLLAAADAVVGLPPGLVITAEYDPLRDEGEAYGERLRAAGVDVTVTRYDGVIHGFFSMGDLIPDGATAVDQAGKALRTAFE